MIRQLIFGGKKSFSDYDMRIVGIPQYPPPQKRNNILTIPFTNGEFDQDKLIRYFDARAMTYNFFIRASDRANLEYKVMRAVEWLLNTNRGDIYDTAYMRYHFSGKCLSIDTEYDEFLPVCTLTANFTADPYRIGSNLAYEEWDTFDFENGYLNDLQTYSAGAAADEWVSYSIYISSEFQTETNVIYIPPQGAGICEINVKLRGTIYTFSAAGNTVFKKELRLYKGLNEILIKGKGGVQFDTREKVL